MPSFAQILNTSTLGLVHQDSDDDAPTSQKAVVAILTLIGFCFLAFRLFSLTRLLLSVFVLPGKPLSAFGPRKSWALVTGASDGIGREFALQLARQNFSVLLVSRTASKLAAVADEITAHNPNAQTKTFTIDFGAASADDYGRLAALVDSLDVAILINNVGASHAIPVPFTHTPPAEIEKIITINTLATLRVTQLVAPGMVARKRGLILTMGSFAGLYPTPLLATYSGSKAFLQHWSTALGAELQAHGITVQLVQTYLVTSAMSKVRRPTATVPSPRPFVRSVLRHIGRTGGAQDFAHTSTPFWSHALAQWCFANTVGFTGYASLALNLDIHQEIRKRALRKAERDKGGKKA